MWLFKNHAVIPRTKTNDTKSRKKQSSTSSPLLTCSCSHSTTRMVFILLLLHSHYCPSSVVFGFQLNPNTQYQGLKRSSFGVRSHAVKTTTSVLETTQEENSQDATTTTTESTDPILRPSRLQSLSHRMSFRKKETTPPGPTIRNVQELRQRVLHEHIPLRELHCDFTPAPYNATTATAAQLSQHAVLQLIQRRITTNSTPAHRAADDRAHLSLAIEGGGMRGAHCAGMSAAIASLGLSDAFDSVYGSSAGAIVGTYFVSRQMCIDVYTRVLPAAGKRFASKGRVMSNVGVGYVNDVVARWKEKGSSLKRNTATPTVSLVEDPHTQAALHKVVNASRFSLMSGRLSSMAVQTLSQTPLLNRTPALMASLRPYFTLQPGMNLTFVLDGIMNSNHGLRPLDMDAFRSNDRKQPMHVIASTVRGDGSGKLETVAFNSREGDFFDMYIEGFEDMVVPEKTTFLKRTFRTVKDRVKRPVKRLVAGAVQKSGTVFRRLRRKRGRRKMTRTGNSVAPVNSTRRLILQKATECPENSGKSGLFACLESSMLVPGAAGPPVKLLRSKHRQDVQKYGLSNMTSTCFDAFCYEPIPYRSAVENGATHVLTLRSRPDGCAIPTKPATYEKLVAPVYFRRFGIPIAGAFFESGASQYRYLEDVLTLDEGLAQGIEKASWSNFTGVKVPPPDILYGAGKDDTSSATKKDPNSWKSAHLLPVVLPANTPELAPLTQEKEQVLEAVRDGYAAAFDMLAPIAGINFDPAVMDSKRIAAMVFPGTNIEDDVLETPVQIKGEVIGSPAADSNSSIEKERTAQLRFVSWIARKRRKRAREKASQGPFIAAAVEAETESPGMVGGTEDSLDWLEAEALLAALPGFQRGKLTHLSEGLRSQDEPAPL